MPKGKYVVAAAYEARLEYGGPEEGGWWFRCGSRNHDIRPIRIPARLVSRIETTEDEDEFGGYRRYVVLTEKGHRFMRKMNRRARWLNKQEGRRDMSSVIGDSETEWNVCAGKPPEYYPDRRPYYC